MTTRIRNEIKIDRPIAEVYEYVTTPGNWPQWHPSSVGVSGATDHSLEVGEQVAEQYLVAGRSGEALWTVTERIVPHRWVIRGEIIGRSSGGTVTYQLSPDGNATRFEREFAYPTPGVWFRLLNALIFRRRVAAESAEAVRRLRVVLEDKVVEIHAG